MPAGPLSGPGVGLPYPQGLYPNALLNGALQPGTNEISLAPGQTLPIPRGMWAIETSGLAFVQFLDPVTGIWRNFSSARTGMQLVQSDGFTKRVANLTGCAIASVLTATGSGYAQATTTVVPSAGNSTWQPIVGGWLGSTVSITNAGSGYGLPPLVIFPAPPAGLGVAATGVATIANGTVSAITLLNVGAGYQGSLLIPAIYPDPSDPNYLSGATMVGAAAQATITGAGSLSAVLCTNSGASFSSLPTLTIAGAGTSAAASIVQLTTLTGSTVTGGGAGFNASAFFTTFGGFPSYTPIHANPAVELTGYIPRPAQATLAQTTGTISSLSTIVDGGLFAGTPTGVVLQGNLAPTTAATITLGLGGANTTVIMTNLG